MDAKEWTSYVNKVATGAWPIPVGMIRDQSNWLCRSIVGRALYFKKEWEDALAVLSTVVEVEPDMTDAPDQGLSECEHKVLCLRDIAEIVWKYAKQEEATLRYIDEGLRLSRAYEAPFRNGVRGELWYMRLMVLKEAGKPEQALREAEAMIEAEHKCSHAPKQADPNSKVNPYIYFSYKFMAEQEYEAGHVAEACSRYVDAFAYYPLNDIAVQDLEKAMAITDPEERYKAYVRSAGIMYKNWEKLPEVVIRH